MQQGDRIDRYVVDRVLGSGGFGTVYRAKHTFTDRTVALKVLRPDRDGSPQLLDRFLQEARASAAIGSPHIVQVLDAGLAESGRAFLAMELLEGEDLAAHLERRKKLPVEETVRIARELLAGLAAAHARGIVHRDLKPANVFLARTAGGATQVKILDFGISKMRVPGRLDGLTRTGMVLGTPSYMSPEQFRGARDVDGRADLYSAAVILYQMVSGKVPFDAESYETLLLKVSSEPPIPLARVAPEVPMPIVYVIERGLARDPDARWQSAADLSAALDAALRGESPLAGSPSTARGGRPTGPFTPAPSTPPTRVWSQSGEVAPGAASAGPASQPAATPMRTQALPPEAPAPMPSPAVRERRGGASRVVLLGVGALLAATIAGGGVVALLSVFGGDGSTQPTYGVAPVAPVTSAPAEQPPAPTAEQPKPPVAGEEDADEPIAAERPEADPRERPRARPGPQGEEAAPDEPAPTADPPPRHERPGLSPSISRRATSGQAFHPRSPGSGPASTS